MAKRLGRSHGRPKTPKTSKPDRADCTATAGIAATVSETGLSEALRLERPLGLVRDGSDTKPTPKCDRIISSALNVKVKKFNKARVNGGSNYDSLKVAKCLVV